MRAAAVMPPTLGNELAWCSLRATFGWRTHPPATKCAHDLATGAGFIAISTSFDLCAASCSPARVVGGIICVPEVFVKAGTPVGIEEEMAIGEDSCVGARHRLLGR